LPLLRPSRPPGRRIHSNRAFPNGTGQGAVNFSTVGVPTTGIGTFFFGAVRVTGGFPLGNGRAFQIDDGTANNVFGIELRGSDGAARLVSIAAGVPATPGGAFGGSYNTAPGFHHKMAMSFDGTTLRMANNLGLTRSGAPNYLGPFSRLLLTETFGSSIYTVSFIPAALGTDAMASLCRLPWR
jgi:hypothetical protein